MEKLMVENSIHIAASGEQVWDVLVNPEHTK